MPITVSEKEAFEPAPNGLHHAVCCDVIDRGIVDGPYGPSRKVAIRWQLEARDSTGARFVAQRVYFASLGPKSDLTKDLQSWRGIPFTEAEKKLFDLERLIGVNAQLTIVQKEGKDGTVYGNVTAIVQLGKGMAKMAIENYTRQVNRPPTHGINAITGMGGQTSGSGAPQPSGPVGPTPPPVEDPIPF